MKSLGVKVTSILAIVTAAVVISMVTAVSIQQASAPRQCPGCGEFKKLSHDFIKEVIEAASIGNPNEIPGLLEQYNQDVLETFELTPRG